MIDELPPGWVRAQLDEATLFVPTGVPMFRGEVEYFSTGSIQSRSAAPEGRFTFQSRPARANRWSKADDVFQARMQGTDKGLLIGKQLAGRLFSTRFLQLQPHTECSEPRFVAHYVRSPEFLVARDELSTGSTQVALTDEGARRLTIPLPPLAEQRRIVAKLETLLDKSGVCQQRLAKIPVLLKRFRRSVLSAACSGRLTADWREMNSLTLNVLTVQPGKRALPPISEDEVLFAVPEAWQWIRLGSVARFINGDRGKNYPNRNEYVPQGIPFINTGHIEPDGSLSADTMHHLTRKKFDSLRSGKIQKGDLVYCLRGATLGKTALVEPYEEGAIASSLVIIRLNDIVHRPFAYYFLTSPYGKVLVDRFDNGSAQPNLSADSVKNYVIPLPPLAEQQEIVHRVEGLFALADQIELRLKQTHAQVEKLRPSLLAKAFRGELVPQDPMDEPALDLLKRIKGNGAESAARRRSR